MSKNCCKKTSIGGQAVIEGIMMKGPERTTLAVRGPKKDIILEDVDFPNPAKKCKVLGTPVIRGVANFIATMMVGMKTLMRSADLSGMTELEELEEQEKKDKKLRKKAERMGVPFEELKEKEEQKPNKLSSFALSVVMTIGTVLGFALAIVLFMWVPSFLFDLLKRLVGEGAAPFRALFEGVLKVAIFIGYIVIVSQMNEIKRVFKYHGAEHKTIFCYEAGEELTVENVKNMSRFHPRCGTSFMFLMIAVGVLISTVISLVFPVLTTIRALWVTIRILLVPLFCGIGYELIKICGKHDNLLTRIIATPGLWVQRLTTKEPDDDMIEVAIAAMNEVIPSDPELDKI